MPPSVKVADDLVLRAARAIELAAPFPLADLG
jgi:hypothetical protein